MNRTIEVQPYVRIPMTIRYKIQYSISSYVDLKAFFVFILLHDAHYILVLEMTIPKTTKNSVLDIASLFISLKV